MLNIKIKDKKIEDDFKNVIKVYFNNDYDKGIKYFIDVILRKKQKIIKRNESFDSFSKKWKGYFKNNDNIDKDSKLDYLMEKHKW